MPASLLRDLLKFSLVGVLNTLITFLVFNALLFVIGVATGPGAGAAYLIGYGAGLVNSFFWNKRWVFNHGTHSATRMEFIRFAGVTAVVGIAGSILVYLLTTYVVIPGLSPGLWANIAFILTVPLSTAGNFFGYKRVVFIKRP